MVVTTVVSVMFLQRHFEGVTRQMTASMSHELTFVARLIDSAATPDAARRAGCPSRARWSWNWRCRSIRLPRIGGCSMIFRDGW
ncbi:hypothetical protein FLP41_15005 [Paracoccus marcusii]|uniref:hypothetical protein n=1 Tax=Paracoccus marcusii TaxID=59779 RepID=UPI002ED3DD47|nr:hypothetical protein FLP41_15005 [Paracoccus marcusii]